MGSGLLRWYNNKRAEKEDVAGFGVVVRLAAFGSFWLDLGWWLDLGGRSIQMNVAVGG